MLMLRAFADESHDSGNVMTMAGFLAPTNTWRVLWADWNAVLSQKEFAIKVFHASDCESAQKDFEGWERDRITDLQTQLLSVLTDPRPKSYFVAPEPV